MCTYLVYCKIVLFTFTVSHTQEDSTYYYIKN